MSPRQKSSCRCCGSAAGETRCRTELHGIGTAQRGARGCRREQARLLQRVGIAVTAGITGPAPPASPPSPVTCIPQPSSPPQEHSTHRAGHREQARGWLRDKGALHPLSETGTHVRGRKSADPGGREGTLTCAGLLVGTGGGRQLFTLRLQCLT